MLPILGGILIDKKGIRIGLIVFSGLIVFGQMFVMIGGYERSYACILFGRAIYAIGGEALKAAQMTMVCLWFRGQELNFALALSLSFSQFGSNLNTYISPEVYEQQGLGSTFLVGFMMCLISLFAAIAAYYLDKKADGEMEEEKSEEEKFFITDIRFFTFAFWLLVIDSLFIYATVFVYIQNVTNLLKVKYNFSLSKSAVMFGIPYIVSIILGPILGLISDRFGRRIKMLILAHGVFILAFFISATLPECPEGDECYYEFAPLFFVGIGYSIFLAFFWGAIPLTVEEKSIGTAYGVSQAFQNISVSFAQLLIDKILLATQNKFGEGTNYGGVDGFYIALNLIGVFFTMFLHCWDKHKCESVLNTPGYYQTEYEEEEEDAAPEAEIDDNQSAMKRKKKQSVVSGMSFASNARSVRKFKKPSISGRS